MEGLERRVIVIGKSSITCLDSSPGSTQSFDFLGECFLLREDIKESNNFGFYDWLRRSRGEVIGVRMGFFSHVPDELNRPDLFFVDKTRLIIKIFFGVIREVDESISDDAILGGVELFIGGNGSVGISLGCKAEELVVGRTVN